VNHFVTVKWVNGRSVFIRGCRINLLNGVYGNFDNTSGSELDGMKISYDSATNTSSCDILIEGNTFQNVRRSSSRLVHSRNGWGRSSWGRNGRRGRDPVRLGSTVPPRGRDLGGPVRQAGR
jgi:hypothetical protein